MSTESLMQELAGKLAVEYIPKALAGSGIPEPMTRLVLETLIGALQEQQKTSDEKLRRLVGSYYQSGMDYLADARSLQGDRRIEWIKLALDKFVTASHVEDTLLAAKSQFFVGVCYDLLNENLLAREWYERAYRSLGQFALRSQQTQQLKDLLDSLFPVLFAHGSTLSIDQPIKTLGWAFYLDQSYALINLRRNQEAIASIEQALRLTPNSAATWVIYLDKGKALYQLGRYEEALIACDQAIRLDPKKEEAYINKGAVLKALGRYEEALIACEQAIRLDTKYADAYNTKGVVLKALGRYEEALIACEQAIRLDPHSALAYDNKAGLLERLGRNNEAQQFYEKARRLG